MKAELPYQMPADLPEETHLVLSALEAAPWAEDHTGFLVLYTQIREMWFNCSVETTVSSTVADSQEFKIKCWPLVMKMLQNKKYFTYLKVKCLPFLTAVNVFA